MGLKWEHQVIIKIKSIFADECYIYIKYSVQHSDITFLCASFIILDYGDDITNGNIFRTLDVNGDKKLLCWEPSSFAEDFGFDLKKIDTNQDELIDNAEFVTGVLQDERVIYTSP